MDNILYIGRLNGCSIKGGDGVQIKNNVFINHLSRYAKVRVIDLDSLHTKSKVIALLEIFWTLICHLISGKAYFVASGGSTNSCKMVRLIKLISFGRPVNIVGLGGNMHKYITSNQKNIDSMKNCNTIMAEGREMVKVLKDAGLTQTIYVPNCKEITYLPTKDILHHNVIKFVFFARINPAKGCDIIFEAVDILNNAGYKNQFSVDFYGYKLESYAAMFDAKIAEFKDNVRYQGARLATKPETFNELASYDVMLFPTYWEDEGFPATIVDAFVAGLPVIASDWKCNGELITNQENGFLVRPKDSKDLADKMLWFINHRDVIPIMAKRMQQEAVNYDIRNILSEDYLKKIGVNI